MSYIKKYSYLFIALFLFSGCAGHKKNFFQHSLVKEQKKNIIKFEQSELHQPHQIHVVVVIDVFRAFTTAAYVLERHPATYMLTTKSTVISRLAKKFKDPLLIGKSEKGANLTYDIPNSPTRLGDVKVMGRNVLHRTEAGAKGVFLAGNADIILVASLVNAEATVKYIKSLSNAKVTIWPMGHEGTIPSLEDDICAKYIKALINGKKINLAKFVLELKEGPGKYFFGKDQWQYPYQDFDRCLEIGRFNFAIKAVVIDDYAILTRCN